MSNKHLNYNFDQIKESGLLSAERIAELERTIEACKIDIYDKEGNPLRLKPEWQVWKTPKGTFISLKGTESARKYSECLVLVDLLTEAEFESINSRCSEENRRRMDKERLRKARREFIDTYAGGVWWGDTFYRDVEDFYEALAEYDEVINSEIILWATHKTPVVGSLDISDIVGHLIDDLGWEDMTIDDLYEVEAFSAAVTAFREANRDVVSYTPDYSLALVLPAERVREIQARHLQT